MCAEWQAERGQVQWKWNLGGREARLVLVGGVEERVVREFRDVEDMSVSVR